MMEQTPDVIDQVPAGGGVNTPASARDIAWLAGLMEGEASFSTGARRPGALRISMKSTDEDVLRRAVAVFNVGTINGPYTPPKDNPGVKPYWCWSVHRQVEAAGLMMTLLPFMGDRRRARIIELLEGWRTVPSLRHWCKNGHPKQGKGRCAECKREWAARQ